MSEELDFDTIDDSWSSGNDSSQSPKSLSEIVSYGNFDRVEAWKYEFYNDMDFFMTPFITHVCDVIGDGHCGFRALAEILGWGQSNWRKLRWDLVKELDRHAHLYGPFFDALGPVEGLSLKDQWHYYDAIAPREHWMRMPTAGVVFATLYNVVLVYLDQFWSVTYLPLTAHRSGSPPPDKVLYIARLEVQQHFVAVWLEDDAPIPPVDGMWYDHHDASVEGWDRHLYPRINKFLDIAPGWVRLEY